MVRRDAQAKSNSDDGQRIRTVCRCCAGWVESIGANVVTSVFVKWALIGIGVFQLSTLFMQIRGGAPRAAMAGPAGLLGLAVIYWFIRT